MPISGRLYSFNRTNVDNAPDTGGVYALYLGDELIYIGRAQGGTVTIRSRLEDHLSGRDGTCTQRATGYRREQTAQAAARERTLLEEFKLGYWRLPRCNERVG